ncbi:MAG: T9SS type A sorting domain-containing protein, partial [Phaeodactylibacter sp.]|nr:T9SS type A sorting domain-containing protein [Phaeodactylibacter sp.]
AGEALLEVRDLGGQLVHTQQMGNAQEQRIMLAGLSAGMYLLQLYVEGEPASAWTLIAIQ